MPVFRRRIKLTNDHLKSRFIYIVEVCLLTAKNCRMDSGFSIPSLGPPRAPSSNDTGKENVFDALKLGQASSSSRNEISKNSPLHDSSKIKPQPLGHRTPQTLNSNKKKLIFSSSPLPRTSSKTPNKSRSVLRY